MKNSKIALSMLVLFAVLIVFAVSTVSAQEEAVYFVPQHGTIEGGPCNNITVEVWVNTTSGFDNWQTDITFDPTCINITNVTYPTTGGWLMSGLGFGHFGNYLRMSNMRSSCSSENPELLATLIIHCEAWSCTSPLNFTGTHFVKCMAAEITLDWQNGTVTNEAPPEFDTGPGTYPGIMGTHNGTITPNVTIVVSKLYTYSCPGTGGHTESIEIYENNTLIANGTWNGYQGDWHNITIQNSTGGTPHVILLENHEYNYTIRTGSYPQIHHTDEREAEGGMGIINCTSFVDANGKVYDDWIPAIKLFP